MKISRYGNFTVEQVGTKIVVTIETDEEKVDVQLSKSGKSLVIATTGGAHKLPDERILNLTLYRKA